VAGFILSEIHNQLSSFIKVYPKDYKKAIQVKNAEKINVL
jgi:hypothetical protein